MSPSATIEKPSVRDEFIKNMTKKSVVIVATVLPHYFIYHLFSHGIVTVFL